MWFFSAFIINVVVSTLLKEIDFKDLWPLIIDMEETKEAIWKYLQLILFTCSQCVDGLDSFGDTAKMFEAIGENDLLEKLTSTIENMNEIFDMSENMNYSENDISVNIPDANDLHSHLKNLLDGNLGKLAHEIAEETAEELQQDMMKMILSHAFMLLCMKLAMGYTNKDYLMNSH